MAPTAVLAVGGVTGNVSGVVHDASGAGVQNVSVTAASGSGSYKATTDANGAFNFLGLPSDTYTISFEKTGYQPATLRGVTVQGDSTVSLGTISVSRANSTIGRVTARSANSAYQPSVAIDTTTLSGQRISQALGNATNTDEAQLLRAAPSVGFDTSGNVAIRGSLASELGYQFDGVNFASPFFDENGAGGQVGGRNQNGYLNGFGAGTGGSVQIVSGSGDATQGNIGAGVINIVPPRGTYPPGGIASFTFENPYKLNQYDLDYGIATPSGNLSNYFAYDQSTYGPEIAPFGTSAADANDFYGTSNTKHYDFLDNFFFRFGKNNNQSIQLLYRTITENQYGNEGGYQGVTYFPYNPVSSGYLSPALGGAGLLPANPTQAQIAQVINANFPLPYYNGQQFLTQPEQIQTTNTALSKVGYNLSLGSSTFIAADFYHLVTQQTQEYYSVQGTAPAYSETGGQRVGFDFNVTEQFGTKHTVTIATKYEVAKPRWFDLAPSNSTSALGITGSYDPPYQAGLSDFAVPNAQGVCPIAGGCYVYDALLAKGLLPANGQIPQIPTAGIDYHNSTFTDYGVGIRDQWQVTPRLKLDYGLREDGGVYKFGPNIFGSPTQIYSNPSDLGSSQLGPKFLTPNVIQPRFALSFQIDPNDTIRGSYGRSVEFAFAQTAGTPENVSNVNPLLAQIPAKDSAATPACGSGFNNLGVKGYSTNNQIINAGSSQFFQCQNYAQQLFWAIDQVYDAPDYGGVAQPTFSNYDVAYEHQFTQGPLRGWGTNLTAYWRRGFNAYQNVLVTNGPPDPVTGQSSASVFAVQPNGNEKVFGMELGITTPDVPYGFSGFLSASYLASFSTQPPASNGNSGLANTNFASDTLTAILLAPLYGTGTYFRTATLPPFEIRVGGAYTTKGGFKINPIFSANTGNPIGVGSTTIATINGPNPIFIPASNFGVATPIGGSAAANQPFNSGRYVDPALPGSYFAPNIAATRGYNDAPLAGGNLSRPQTNIDLDLEYSFGVAKRNVIGMYVSDILDTHYGTPYYNTKWQPVSTGTGGPQTGQQNTSPDPYSAAYTNYLAGIRDQPSFAGGYTPFSYSYGAGTVFNFYLQRKF
jgi:hypothetical protein